LRFPAHSAAAGAA